MYICLECGELFVTPKHYKETHGLDTPPYEEWNGCPKCSGNYVEVYTCAHCNQDIIDGNYIKLPNGERYCENCYETFEAGETE